MVEGNKKTGEFTVRFGKISQEQADALLSELSGWRRDNAVPVPVTLGGRRFDFLYLHSLIADRRNGRPVGLVFSNELP